VAEPPFRFELRHLSV